MLIRSVEAQGADRIERQACVTHKAFSHNCHLCQLLAFCLGAPFFLHTKDCAFILYIALSFACLLCVEALWVQYKRLWRVVAKQSHKAQWHNERNVLIMRAPSVAPCGAVPWVPSSKAQRGNGIGETHEEGGEFQLIVRNAGVSGKRGLLHLEELRLTNRA